MREAHVPTQQPSSPQEARISHSDAYPRRSGRTEVPSGQGPQAARRLTWRIRDRATFAQFRRAKSWRRGPITVRCISDGQRTAIGAVPPPRLAFAMQKAVGSAVTRNRVRRRLQGLVRTHRELLVPGVAYLVSVQPEAAAMNYSDLDRHFSAVLQVTHRELV